MVQPETRLYTIADLSTVWVLAQVFQNDLGRIKVGSPASLTVDSYPGRVFRGKVDFIYPDVDMTTRTARAPLVFSNRNLTLSPGMFVNVSAASAAWESLVDSGERSPAVRDAANCFRGPRQRILEPREVQLGPQAGDEYIVLKGLKAARRIVTSANFLIDSESQLQAAIGSFAPSSAGPARQHARTTPPRHQQPKSNFSTEPQTPQKGTNLYRVKLTVADGSPVTGAQVSVRSYMPGMPEMGMAAMNVVTPLSEKGDGVYEGQVNLESGGTWQITVTAIKSGPPCHQATQPPMRKEECSHDLPRD